MAHEIGLALKFLVATLSGDTTLMNELAPGGVHRAMASPGTPTPFVIVANQDGNDVLTMNAVRVMSDLLFQVKAAGPASNTGGIVAAASRIDELLKRTSGTVTNGIILSCYRDSPLEYDEPISGVQWSHFGGLYRLEIQQV
jgi:hypothetical protein